MRARKGLIAAAVITGIGASVAVRQRKPNREALKTVLARAIFGELEKNAEVCALVQSPERERVAQIAAELFVDAIYDNTRAQDLRALAQDGFAAHIHPREDERISRAFQESLSAAQTAVFA